MTMNKTKEIIELVKTLPCYQNGSHYIFDKDIDQFAQKINQLYDDWPKEGDEFWYFHADGEILHENYNNTQWHKDKLQFGNCFKTEKEATEARDKVKQLLNELR